MEIKVTIQVSQLENWQRFRLEGIVKKIRAELENIQYEQDAAPSIEIQEMKPGSPLLSEVPYVR